MDELMAWLREQLDADEVAARLCAEMFPSPWEVADRGWRVRIYSSAVPDEGDHAEPGDMRAPCVIEVEPTRHHKDTRWLSERVEHIAIHDPASVLADVAAKRAIVDEVVRLDELALSGVATGPEFTGALTALRHAVGLLAEAYDDRPGYQESWRPARIGA